MKITLQYSRLTCLLFFLGLSVIEAQAQEANIHHQEKETNYSVSSELYTATNGNLPFWFYSNVHGTVDPASTNWLNHISVQHQLLNKNQKSVLIGGESVLRLSEESTILFPKLFLTAKAYGLQLDVGRFSQPIGLNNHELSSGSMMVSNNAMPVPKISLSTQDYLDVPLTDGYLQYKGMFSHGWLEEDRFVSNAYLHQKYFYLRLNVGPFSGIGGMVHNAQWGGTSPTFGRLPQSFNDYLRIITARGADKNSNGPDGEKTNVIGNSIAAYDFGLQYRHENYTLLLTRMFYLEDKVSTRFRSPWDGVWGINVRFKDSNSLINGIIYEHINTKTQDSKSWELIGSADYYDHFIYQSGWTYENRSLGTPLILTDGTNIFNNVLIAHHIGVSGQFTERVHYKALLTYSRNYGVQNDWVNKPGEVPKDDPSIMLRENFRKHQFSTLVSINYFPEVIQNFQVNVKLTTDFGQLYDNNLGIMVGVSWGNKLGKRVERSQE